MSPVEEHMNFFTRESEKRLYAATAGKKRNKPKFYLSASRTKRNIYRGFVLEQYQKTVTLVLDPTFYNNIKGVTVGPVDHINFWDGDGPAAWPVKSESEERIWSMAGTLPIDGIKEIHWIANVDNIRKKEGSDGRLVNPEYDAFHKLKRMNIPTWIYPFTTPNWIEVDTEPYMSMNKNKAIPLMKFR